jgi:methylmalonyl-CoA mutase C-terminal domain/subunit
MNKIPRVLIAKIGLDGHDRGAKVVAQTLRDSGFEVIYTGLHQSASQIISTAIQEDVDAIGVSILSGAHKDHFKKLMDEIHKNGIGNLLVFGGGVIPNSDLEYLFSLGVTRIFTSGSALSDIVTWLNESLSSDSSRTELNQ